MNILSYSNNIYSFSGEYKFCFVYFTSLNLFFRLCVNKTIRVKRKNRVNVKKMEKDEEMIKITQDKKKK